MLLTSENTVEGTQLISFIGCFDKYAKDKLEAAIARAQTIGCHHIILNLARLSGIDSSGLGRILLTHYRLQPQGIRVSLIGPTPQVREMLELVHITDSIPVFDTSQEAMEKQEHGHSKPVPRRASKRRSSLASRSPIAASATPPANPL
jgi:anti-anti-sigma factor